MTTIATLITNVQEGIGEVAGPGVQAFSEERIHKAIKRTFNMLWVKYPWEQYKTWNQLTIDGSTGVVTVTNVLHTLRRFHDVITVRRTNTNSVVTPLPNKLNPYTISGTTVQHYTSLPVSSSDYTLKKLLFWPLATADIVDICHKVYPTTIDLTTQELYLDDDLIEYGAMMMMLATEDLSEGGYQLARELFDMRYTDIMAALSAHDIGSNRASDNRHLTQWST